MAHKAADGAVVPVRTWPFTASRVPASVYGTMYDAGRICDVVRAAYGVCRTATAYMAIYGIQGCRWRMSYELVRGTHDACRIYDGVRGRPR